jgi:hypothetical protein
VVKIKSASFADFSPEFVVNKIDSYEYIAGSLSYKKLSNSQDMETFYYVTKLLQQIRDT